MERRPFLLAMLSLPLISAAPLARVVASVREPVIGACEGCEAVFEGLPPVLGSRARIAPAGEPGQPLTLAGRVTDLQGRPRPGVVVYAYHTNRGGLYPPPDGGASAAAARHGRLRGWARTDSSGAYRFDTIRPGAYPGEEVPEHIHMHVLEPGRATYYLDDVMFRDDPRLTRQQADKLVTGRGGHGLATPERRDGTWWVRRDVVLGKEIQGYPRDRT